MHHTLIHPPPLVRPSCHQEAIQRALQEDPELAAAVGDRYLKKVRGACGVPSRLTLHPASCSRGMETELYTWQQAA
jgi:hypothetical protein